MISNTPPAEAVAAINSGFSKVTRRVEIYESDGETLWVPSNGDTRSRLVTGSISVDYGRDERRTIDLTLANTDGVLTSRSGEGFWYNKVLKVYRGVRYGDDTWETQMGEFLIDKIDSDLRSGMIKVSGRDPWKKLMTSKLQYSMSFPAGTYLYELVRALAANAGITKLKIPFTNETLSSALDLERGTERGAVIKQACNSHNYDVYFDNQGYLTMEKYADPTLSPSVIVFKTGPSGNLVDYQKSINDSRLYNHVIVYGDREAVEGGTILMPYFGEAKNENPNSPTSIQEIGDRVWTFASSFFTSDDQCQELANSRLAILSLETYEINWSSIYYPWLDVGRIVDVIEPDATIETPTKFLLDTIDFPLSLAPMGATGKRVLVTG